MQLHVSAEATRVHGWLLCIGHVVDETHEDDSSNILDNNPCTAAAVTCNLLCPMHATSWVAEPVYVCGLLTAVLLMLRHSLHALGTSQSTAPPHLHRASTHLCCAVLCCACLCRCVQRSAAVVYDSAEGVSAAMKQAGSGQLVQYELPQPEGPVGLKAWVAAHKAARPGNVELQKQVRHGWLLPAHHQGVNQLHTYFDFNMPFGAEERSGAVRHVYYACVRGE